MEPKHIISNVCLLEFGERKLNEPLTLVDSDKLVCMLNNYILFEPSSGNYEHERLSYDNGEDLNSEIMGYISYSHKHLYDILIVGTGKVSICGLSIIDLITPETLKSVNIYLHSCTLVEANKLFRSIIDILKEYYGQIHESSNTIIFLQVDLVKVVLMCDLYKNKEEILRTIDSSVERHGWDPINGYFGTIPAAITVATCVTPVNLNIHPFRAWNYHIRNIFLLSECNFVSHTKQKFNIIKDGSIVGSVILFDTNEIKNSLYRIANAERNYITMDYDDIGDIKLPEGEHILPIFNYNKECNTNIRVKQNNTETVQLIHIEHIEMKEYVSLPILSYRELWGNVNNLTIVGISDDRYVAFANIRRIFNISCDLFRLLCYYWLKAEVDTAKKVLAN